MYSLVVYSGSVTQELDTSRELRAILEGRDEWETEWAAGEGELSAILRERPPCLILALLQPTASVRALEPLIALLSTAGIFVPIVAVLPEGTSPDELCRGAPFADFVTLPLRPLEIRARVRRVLDRVKAERMADGYVEVETRMDLEAIVGEDHTFVAVKAKLPAIARAEATVLISGETGTGKEIIARAIHYLSRRTHAPFLPVNCGAIPTELFENELFGHKRGAFTDARTVSPGIIAEAERGTLFLDEVDTIPLPAQVKLLHFLQHRTYRALGGAAFQHADVRIIAATNVDLEMKVKSGGFREDLFYRLNIISIALPPLRERCADIPLLARHLVAKYTNPEVRGSWQFTEEFFEFLHGYAWPGNIRELENVIQQIVATRSPGRIGPEMLPPRFHPEPRTSSPVSFREAKARAVAGFEREYAARLLSSYSGNITRAARAADQDRRAFGRLIKKYGIERPSASQRGIQRGGSN